MKQFWGALGKFFNNSTSPIELVAQIPDSIQEHIFQRNMQPLQLWLQARLKTNPDAPERDACLQAARDAGWPEIDIGKLNVFVHYYAGDLSTAFNLAEPLSSSQTFDPDMFIIAAFALYHLSKYEDAYLFFDRARNHEAQLSHRTDYATVGALISNAANRFESMRQHIDNAWRLAPQDPVVALNAYAMYFELGDMDAFNTVKQCFDQGIIPLERAGFALAVIELAQDHYQEGFRLLELRYQMDEAHRYLNSGLFSHPRWNGETLEGKTLLLSAEQGLGDTIQMARYLNELLRLGARKVVMETQPETITLLKYNFPALDIVERKYAQAPDLEFDYWTGFMSLPHLLGTTSDNVPGCANYLGVPPEASRYWHDRVGELARGGQPRIGVAWSGRPTHRADRRRSIPFEQMMGAIRNVEADFFALQTHVPDIHPANLHDVSEEMITLADTAALIAEMDWVISIDTSVVHIAGAIGKETWLLLPYRYEWRWSLEGESNHWYDSVKVLRQPIHGDWDTVLNDVFLNRLLVRRQKQGT